MCDLSEWVQVDEVYGPQIALREKLVASCPDKVVAALPGSEAAQAELLETMLKWLSERPDFSVRDAVVIRPDKSEVALDKAPPLSLLSGLVQQDLCLLENGPGGEHVMTAALLCFPASWSLSEKLGRPLTGIHRPVDEYDTTVAKRVQRLFDALRPDVVLERVNCLLYNDYALFAPRVEGDRREPPGADAHYVRLERQTLRRLPITGAMVFAIHTACLRREDLAPDDATALAAYLAVE